ncbi:MerR family DNA-binding transcriptional regulator, partial [Enterococcus faecalis]
MTYTISQVAKALNIPTSTIRYYDKEGLLPTLARKESGYRLFS